jgi:hypothetical protein
MSPRAASDASSSTSRRASPSSCRSSAVVAAAGLHLDEAELAVGGHRGVAVAGAGRQPDGLVEDQRALLVATADGVDQRAAEGDQRLAPQAGVAAGLGVGGSAAQAVDAGLDGAGGDGRPAGVELADRRGPAADRQARRHPGRDGGRVPQGR